MTTVELIEQIRRQAASLGADERRRLAEELIVIGEDLVDISDADEEGADDAEMVGRRVASIRDGSARLLTGEAFAAQVRAKLASR